MSIPFDTIAQSLLARADSLLPEWFPAGKREGSEFRIGNIRGDKGRSLSINMTTGVWRDFAGDDGGADLISLYAAHHGLSQADAARALAPHLANGHDRTPPPRLPPPPQPVPATPPGPPDTAGAAALYRYTDTWYVARYEPPGGKKSFTPYTWDGATWNKKAPPKPRPLFGLDELAARPDTPVLVVEGEKACLAARGLLAGYVVVTWAGGSSAVGTADLRPLHGRQVDIWPDADEPGRKAAADLAGLLLPHCPRVRIVQTQDAPSEGWDLADAAAEGWTAAQARDWGRDRIKSVLPPPPADEPAPQAATKPAKPPAGATPTSSGEPAYVLWERLQLARNDRGPFATEANALRIIAAHESYAGRIWLDEFAQVLMITDTDGSHRQFVKNDALKCLAWMQESLQLPKMPLSVVNHAAILVGDMNKRHPVKAYLSGLKWDGVDRLESLMADAFGAAQNAYTAAVGRCWLVAMISRIYAPGGQADNVPVFEGTQGIRKSSALRALVGEEWFMESVRNPIKDPDRFSQSLQGKWLVEIPEIDRIGGRYGSLEDLTGIITIRKDTYRMPYAPTFMDYPRQTILAGTTNKTQWNPDQTGGRRYWPISCTEVNIDYIIENRDQLFAEAMARYARGELWHDVPVVTAKEEQEMRRLSDEWETVIEHFVTHRPDRQSGPKPFWYERDKPLDFITVSQLLSDALDIPEARWSRGDQMRVAACLNALGYVRCRSLVSGVQQWGYRKAAMIAWAAKN